MNIHKVISTVFHPVVIPSLGILLYFMFVSHSIQKSQQLLLLALIFGITYMIPILILILLRSLRFIKNFQVETIEERKFPVLMMLILFFVLGDILADIYSLRDIGYLFYGVSLGLFCTYVLFSFKIKSSLHLLSMGTTIGFFLLLMNIYGLPLLLLVIILIVLSGLIASSRLHLNAHSPNELAVGFLLGLLSQTIIFLAL